MSRWPAIDAQPGVELLAEPLHLLRLGVEHLVLPALGDRAQQRDQRGGGGEHDVAGRGLLDEVGHRLQRGLEDRLAREEQHHELRGAGQRLPVAPGAQVGDVLADVLAQPGQRPLVLGGVVCAGEVEERGERSLGVDRDRAPAGEGDDEVGTQPAVVEARLLGEVAVVDQPRELDGPAQVELAPLPAHLRLAQGGRERVGLVAQHVGRVANVGDLLVELGLPGRAVVGQVAQLVLQPLEPVLDDRVVGDALLQRGDRGVVRRAAACPQHADHGTEGQPDGEDGRQGQHEGEGVHGSSMAAATDITRRTREGQVMVDSAAAPRKVRR